MKIYHTFHEAILRLTLILLTTGYKVKPNNWQSMDVSQRAEAEMIETLNQSFQVPLGSEKLEWYQKDIQPNLPWADRHFELERVSGLPINPGETWKEWPWGHSAEKFQERGVFDHTYAERYWPKETEGQCGLHINRGIRYPYGDLNDVVDRLIADPITRQAVLSVWHPEDQHNGGQRVPCSLFYHFIQRNGYLHIVYSIRSCDALRHFRDDCYLTVRLLLWVLDRLREKQKEFHWTKVKPGTFTMHITSLHAFVGDKKKLESML
jgi:thymidylate synthase